MTGQKKTRVIILENNDTIQKHAESILSAEGWAVICEQASIDALNTLARSKNSPIALFISNFKLPKMAGDDILQKVKSISPLTQRMLMVPANEPETLINAINKAEINACITAPFNDEDLMNKAKTCFKRFQQTLKRQQLKRVIVHQNKQMFNIAQKLKKKNTLYQHRIDEKTARRLKLKSQKRSVENKNEAGTNICLSSLLEQRDIKPTPETIEQEFILLCNTIKHLFDQVAARHHASLSYPPLKSLAFPKILPANQEPVDEDTTQLPAATPQDSTAINQPDLIENIIKAGFTLRLNSDAQNAALPLDTDHIPPEETGYDLEDYLDVSISKDQTKAFLQKIKDPDTRWPKPSLSSLLDLLRQKQVLHGLVDDEIIDAWRLTDFGKKILVAKGKAPVHGHDGTVNFHFETNFTNPGKINPDGSIDFRERGQIPYTQKGDLLGQRTRSQEGCPGISISGTPIPVEEVTDPVFIAGPGTELSPDGLNIHAAIDGQPHCDALGTISVNSELVIPGDVGYETGNINFNGHIIVRGMVKEGFSIKGTSLTAQEIEGGTIDLSGDLNISAGITDSHISTHGHIYAKFINHSTVLSFGDLTVSKEIIDSDILLSGSCQNQTGHIISSRISAKQGIDAGKIGTPASEPARLRMGLDDHIKTLKEQADEALKASVNKSSLLKETVKKKEEQDQALYLQISEKAHVQDRAQTEIKKLKQSMTGPDQAMDAIKKLEKSARQAEKELNAIFETQDRLANEIDQLKTRINRLEEKNKALVIEKNALNEFSKKTPAQPTILVAKTIVQETDIRGPHASLLIRKDRSHCKIQEMASLPDDMDFHEITITDL